MHYLTLNRGDFYAEKCVITKFCHLAIGVPEIMPHFMFILACNMFLECRISVGVFVQSMQPGRAGQVIA